MTRLVKEAKEKGGRALWVILALGAAAGLVMFTLTTMAGSSSDPPVEAGTGYPTRRSRSGP